MAVSFRSQYDLTLSYSGKNYGYQLYEDQYGQKHWNEGLADLIAPQSRISEFSYEHIPPQIDVPAAFENWSIGAGYTEFRAQFGTALTASNTNMPVTYNYSQNIDASWDNRLYLSPLINSAGTLAANPTLYFNSSYFGFWCAANQYLYRYDLSSNSWVLKHTAAANIKSIAELNGVMYVSLLNAAYVYTTSTTGASFTTYTGATLESASIADLFVVRNNVLMAMRAEKAYVTTNGQNAGVVWSAGTSIGSSSDTTQSLAVANNQYWIFKKEGVYMWDGTTVNTIWTPDYITNQNGAYAYVWYDGNIYTTYGSRILAIDPFNTQYSSLKFVYPPESKSSGGSAVGPHDSVEVKGTITQITGTFSDLMFSVLNPEGTTYIIKGDPVTQVYHTLGYISTASSVAAYAVGPNVVHPTNPGLVFARNAESVYYILPRDDLRPEDDPNYRYASTGTIYGPWLGFGARAFDKYLNRGTVLGTDISAAQNIVLAYQINDDTSATTTLVNAINYNLNTANQTSDVSFNRIRYVITMNNGGNSTNSPVMTSATFHATLNPPRRRTWKPLIQLRPNQILRDGNEDYQDVRELRNALFSGVTQRITMTDRENNQYIVRILDIQEVQLAFTNIGGYETDNQVFQVTLAEIAPITSQLQVAKYTQARYQEGYKYA